MLKNLLGAAAFLAASLSSANAATFTYSGELTSDNDVDFYQFTIGSTSEVVMSSSSYVLGGFDPMLWLFGPDGILIDSDDDSGEAWDSYLSLILDAGTYTVAISQYNNSPTGTVNDPYSFAEDPWFRGGFDGRSPNYEFSVSGVESASPAPVPLPAAGFLSLLGLGALGVVRRKRA